MIDQILKDEVLLHVNGELRHQEEFLKNMSNINTKLESEGSPPLYSLQELIKSGESYIKIIQKTVAQIPLEPESE